MPVINFSKEIYSLKAVRSAMKDYSSVADFSFRDKKGFFCVEIKAKERGIEKIIGPEFSNYVLSQMKGS